MKKTFALSFIAFLAGIVSVNAQDMKLDDVLNSYFKTTGIEKMKDWTTLTVKGKTIAQGMEFCAGIGVDLKALLES